MKMTTLTIGLLAITVLFAGCGLAQEGAQDSSVDQAVGVEEVQEDNSETWVGSMADAFLTGKSMKCSWESNGIVSTGYIKGKNVYSETEIDGQITYSLMKDNCTWVWVEGESEGMKMCADEDLIEEDYSDDDFVEYEDWDSADYQMDTEVNCSQKRISGDRFDEPEEIFFIDPYEAFMHDLKSAEVYGL